MIKALGVKDEHSALSPMEIFRGRQLRPNEVRVRILYCGVCHTDIHHVKNDWKDSIYPLVCGHEGLGDVIETNSPDFQQGEMVGIGNLLDSCDDCDSCQSFNEQYCLRMPTMTYNSHERYIDNVRVPEAVGALTFGCYSQQIICRDKFVFKLPQNVRPELLAPLMCAGAAVYWPLRHLNLRQGSLVGVAGIGGLGHMALMMGTAMGYRMVALTRTVAKANDCLSMGAIDVVIHTAANDRDRYKDSLEAIISTIPVAHDVNPLFSMVKPMGTMHILGNFNDFPTFQGKQAFFWGKNLTGSNVAGSKDTQEMVNFCVSNNVYPWVEVVAPSEINEVFDRVTSGNVRYRYVIDMLLL